MPEEYISQPVRLGWMEQLRSMAINRRDRRRLIRLALRAAKESRPDPEMDPVLFFNASTRLVGLSQNAAFSFLTALGLQLAGVPIVHFGCRAGMSRCVLGTVRRTPSEPPPCRKCVSQSERLYGHAPTVWFQYDPDPELENVLSELDVQALSRFTYPLDRSMIPLGRLVVPSIRWALRRHDLEDDEPTRFFLREYLKSAYHLAKEYAALIDRLKPTALVIFNGIMYPEATARWVGLQRNQRVITFEVAYKPFSAFFSNELATRYPIHIPDSFQLNDTQNKKLDTYLKDRFQGDFTMAGIKFWPEMRGLDQEITQVMKRFHQIVPIFTNVIYDTSQVDTNLAFKHMFEWLDHLLPLMQTHSDTLFVIRAHPDEMRPGKESRQNVHDWITKNQVDRLSNVLFIPSREFISSYELIKRSKFVLVYNSSIGLEATLLGIPVVCAAYSRYTQIPIVYFPQTKEMYHQQVSELLLSQNVRLPREFSVNARRFLYYQLYRASLPFDEFLESAERPGFVHLGSFPLEYLAPEHCQTTQVILEGILKNQPFLMPEEWNN